MVAESSGSGEVWLPGSVVAFRRSRVFRFFYLPVGLLYVGLVLFWGRYDLLRVHREYREASGLINSNNAQELAGREVAGGCRQATGGETAPGYGECLKVGARLVEIRAAVISAGMVRAKNQAVKKLAIFYSLLIGVMILPLTLLYVFSAFFRDLLGNIRSS